MGFQVTNSPFNQEQSELLNRLLPTLSESQRIWLSGFLAASVIRDVGASAASVAAVPAEQGADRLAAAALPAPAALSVSPVPSAPAPAAPAVPKEATILFGSQTGNSQGLAKKLTAKLKELGFDIALSSMGDFKPNTLKKVQTLLIVVSTHGEGDPPDNAIPFYEFLHSKRAPQLDGLRFSVLALGDTSYEFFCKTGQDFDSRLEELGGKRIAPRVDCDVDFDEAAAEWMNSVLGALRAETEPATAAGGVAAAAAISGAFAVAAGGADAVAAISPAESGYSRTNPFPAEVLENLNLNGRGSERETRHLELSLADSGLQYEPGDCIGIYPENHPRLVDELIAAMGWNPEEAVPINKSGEQRPLREALTRNFEITVLTKPLLESAARLTEHRELQELVAAGREQQLRAYASERDVLDLVQDYALKGVPAREFVSLFRKLPARLYSIASSPSAYPDEAHLTIRAVRYEAHGRTRYGVCSMQAAERLQPGDTVPVYVHHNPNFKMPQNPDAPLIMIGPGTGVAPFRAFLGEREETGAAGKTWLFYGDQRFLTDFLYQTDWQRWLQEGVLTRMDVAFSRDTDKKVYVQHRMQENSKELYRWLEEGAGVYVCGDEKKMAHDVHATLISIIQQEGGLSPEAAADYVARMQQDKRYQRDVY